MIRKEIRVAVIIPVYNGEKYLGEMLDSILHQTYKKWKLIIVDDGSTDSTNSILADYVGDKRIIVIHRDKEPKGAQTCRNIGFEQSGDVDYVMFLDADDVVASHCFEQRIRYMDSHPLLDFAVFPSRTFSENIEHPQKMGNGIKYSTDDDLCCFFWGGFPFIVWNNIYRKSSLVKHHLQWDVKILSLQDSAYNIQNILSGLKYEYASNVFVDYYYRYNSSANATHSKVSSKEHQASHVYLLAKILCNLTFESKKLYEPALKNYVITYVKRTAFSKNVQILDDILDIPWINSKSFFKFKLLLLFWISYLFHIDCNSNKLYFLIFPRLCMTFRKRRVINLKYIKSYFDNLDNK